MADRGPACAAPKPSQAPMSRSRRRLVIRCRPLIFIAHELPTARMSPDQKSQDIEASLGASPSMAPAP